MSMLHEVFAVFATEEEGCLVVRCELTDTLGERFVADYVSRPGDTGGLNPTIRRWLSENEGGYDVIPYAPPSFEEMRTTKLAAAAAKRWAVETGGITVFDVPVFTDDRSKLMITGARIKADADPAFTTQWVAADGNITTLDADSIIAISNAVLAHVDACFTRFAGLAAAIQGAADKAALEAIDIESGWPLNA